MTFSHSKLTVAALALAATFAGSARADETTPLVELCQSFVALPKNGEVTPEYIQLKSSCAGFINSHVKMSKPEDGFCVPKGYNMDDLATVFMDWANKHQDRWKEPTKVTMTAALSETYPCKK